MSIERYDECTFYVKSSKDPNKEYMVYREDEEYHGTEVWYCDCTDYWIHLPGQGKKPTHFCKHIIRAQLLMSKDE